MSRRRAAAASPPARSGRDYWSGYVWWFMRRRMVLQDGASVDWEALYGAFHAWWTDPDVWAEAPPRAPTAREFGLALFRLCQRAGVPVVLDGTKVYCLGCRLALPGEIA
jgi:hypothetical protein